jgi:hypothetical protein
MFLPDGARLGAVDTMSELWSGRPPAKPVPTLEPLVIEGDDDAEQGAEQGVDPGAEVRVKAIITSHLSESATVRWVLHRESGDYNTGGDFRPMLPEIEGVIQEGDSQGARLRMPEDPGPYRLFLYVYDGDGGAAMANVPLLVKGEVRTPMPFYVYRDSFENMPWAPSGWMGSTELLTLDGENTENPYEGKACIKMRFTGKSGWVGVAWQHPADDWGDKEGGYDLTSATHLELWARGKYAGERMSIGVGLLGKDKDYPDSDKTSVEDILLNDEWQRYRIPLEGIDLTNIKTGFVVTTTGRQTSVNIYLDSIRFVK